MALVANYGSDSAPSDDEDQTNTITKEESIESNVDTNVYSSSGSVSSSSLLSSLPSISSTRVLSNEGYVDADEDVSSIPKPQPWEHQLKPRVQPKKKKTGKVKIVLPFLNDRDNEDNEESSKEAMRKMDSRSKLLAKLPKPEHSDWRSPSASLPSASIDNKPKMNEHKRSNAFIPHSVSKKRSRKELVISDDDEDDDDEDKSSFFNLHDSDITTNSSVSVNTPISVKATPSVVLTPDVATPSETFGPQLPCSSSEALDSYPEVSSDLMANPEALERLAGKHASKFRGVESVRDISASSLVAKPAEWMTKALSEDDADRPGPKCNIKGESKRKHQITYLAALAKENEHKLKQQWAQSAANRRTAGAKYGF